MKPTARGEPGATGGAGFGVLLVTDVYPPGCGGSGWSAHALARTLADRGHPVEVVGIDPGAAGISQRIFDSVRVVEVGVRRARRNPVRRLGARDYAYRPLFDYVEARLRDDPGVGIVHAQHLHGGPPAVAAAARRRCGSVVTLRDYWPVCLHGTSFWGGRECGGCSTTNLSGCMREYWGWPAPLARLMVPWARRRLQARRAGVGNAGRVITVSDWVRGRIAREVDADFEVLPNIVDVDRTRAVARDAGRAPEGLRPEGAADYLVAAGKLVATKGFDRMLDELAAADCGLPLVLAGSGPMQAALARRASELGLDLSLPGWIDHEELLALIAGARAFLLPGAWNEPLSRLLLEALALGAPVIAWRSGGNPEHLTDGVDALVVDGPEELAAALAVLDDPARRARIGVAAETLARRRFAPGAIYPRLQAIYAAALAAVPRQVSGSPPR